MKKSLSFSAFLALPTLLWILVGVQSLTAAIVKQIRPSSTPQEATASKRYLLSQTTSPKTYYVSGSGSDTNNGLSTASPFRTIQKAANLTNPGDTVLIMNGLYTNSHSGYVLSVQRSGTANGWIYYKAYPGHKPKIKHNAWNGVLISNNSSYIEINGLEIEGNNPNITLDYALSQKTNTSNPLTNGNCITVDGRKNNHLHHIRILNNKIHDCGGAGVAVMQADYITLDRNEVYNNAWYSVNAPSGITFYQNWNSDTKQGYKIYVTNNKVYKNRQYVPWIYNGKLSDGSGILIDDAKNTQNNSTLGAYKGRTLIANNISYKNGGAGIVAYSSENVHIINNTTYMNNQSPEHNGGQIVAVSANNIYVWNNILVSPSGKRLNKDWDNVNVSYNYNVYANSTLLSLTGPNDIMADPQFVNPEGGDFRLKPTSPAINNAVDWGLTTDFVGNPRPSGNKDDIGAYEYQF
ncbi:choice-of-anchor Q domain-containing protein [Nostoc cycadae]|uniref:S-layer protein n=1 Tax=Nostoc cycadae WK-1 TaxID=1861711 RepID=A0A2H6LC51_9NOSO|nr:choice-of-anchor Q domain-containing protein [Nostoc cycadae]GBE90768.1 S-layer protein [Nostoc cycadae WK-1]